jgi:pantoate--beta-alanine ligase
MRRVLDTEPLARTEYVSVADPDSLDELGEARAGALVSMAVRVGPARLIDNLSLEPA